MLQSSTSHWGLVGIALAGGLRMRIDKSKPRPRPSIDRLIVVFSFMSPDKVDGVTLRPGFANYLPPRELSSKNFKVGAISVVP